MTKLAEEDEAALPKPLRVQMHFEGLNENQLGAMCKIYRFLPAGKEVRS